MPLYANLVIGQDGSTTRNGTSKNLSSAEDRKRFHQLRSGVEAIVIGGKTARLEPYAQTPAPLYVISRAREIKEIEANHQAKILNQDPKLAIKELKEKYPTKILFEGGAELLNEIIDLVDQLHITISKAIGDGQLVSFDGLTRDFVMEDKEDIDGETFYIFRRLK